MANLPLHYQDFNRGIATIGNVATLVYEAGSSEKSGIDFILVHNSDTVDRELEIQITESGPTTVKIGKVTVPAGGNLSLLEDLRGERSNFEPIVLKASDRLEMIAEAAGVIGVYAGVGIWDA